MLVRVAPVTVWTDAGCYGGCQHIQQRRHNVLRAYVSVGIALVFVDLAPFFPGAGD